MTADDTKSRNTHLERWWRRMGWEDQGRQEHGWFGHGTAPDKGKQTAPDPSVLGQSEADRALALAYGALGSLPPAQRRQVEAQYGNGTLPRLKEALTAWLRATALDGASFGSRLFGRSADDPVVRDLHSAALRAATATSHDDLRDAAERLARAMQGVGIDRWPGFVADAAQRARDPATRAAIEKSKQPPGPGRDAIRPVYPLETAIGIAMAGLAGGAAAAGRAAGGALLRQFMPGSRPSTGGGVSNAAEGVAGDKPVITVKPGGKQIGPTSPTTAGKPPISRQKQDGHIAGTPQNRNRIKIGKPTSTFDGSSAEADALTQEAWQKGTPLPKQPGMREYDFGRRIGTGGYGGGQSSVRVSQDSAGKIHGYPVGRETP